MLGYYNYTVILTYMSLVSAVFGIFAGLTGEGHPFIATTCLMLCGFFDAFDGMIARTRKKSTEDEKHFGIQIDSLTDLLAFGVLPCSICYAIYMSHLDIHRKSNILNILKPFGALKTYIYMIVFCLFVLAALIRLAYFNVSETKRQKETSAKRKEYTGLPVTSAAIIFPTVSLIQFVYGRKVDISPIYLVTMLLTGFLFLSKIKIGKPGLKEILIMVAIGAVEFLFIVFFARAYLTGHAV